MTTRKVFRLSVGLLLAGVLTACSSENTIDINGGWEGAATINSSTIYDLEVGETYDILVEFVQVNSQVSGIYASAVNPYVSFVTFTGTRNGNSILLTAAYRGLESEVSTLKGEFTQSHFVGTIEVDSPGTASDLAPTQVPPYGYTASIILHRIND